MHKRFIWFLCGASFAIILTLDVRVQAEFEEIEPDSTLAEMKKCEQGPIYFDGCNWCQCSKGLIFCSMKRCPTVPVRSENLTPQSVARVERWSENVHPQPPLMSLLLDPNNFQCTADDNVEATFDGCNWCWCNDEGDTECTTQQCE